MIRSIAVVGPESSGKTTIVEDLARRLRAAGWAVEVVVEQGRLLAQQLPPAHPWSYREQLATSRMHTGAQTAARAVLAAGEGPAVLLCDGSCVTPLVWHMSAVRRRPVYDAGPPAATEDLVSAFAGEQYDLVLLVAPDIPWEPDGIRDDPDGREEAFGIYRDLLPEAVIVSGHDRAQTAQEHVSALLQLPLDPP